MKEGGLCPRCKKGHMYFEGKRGSEGESKDPFRETGNVTEYVCDAKDCGHRQKAEQRKLYEDVPVRGGRVTATVTRGKTKVKKKTKK
jgi:hypothetical protein